MLIWHRRYLKVGKDDGGTTTTVIWCWRWWFGMSRQCKEEDGDEAVAAARWCWRWYLQSVRPRGGAAKVARKRVATGEICGCGKATEMTKKAGVAISRV